MTILSVLDQSPIRAGCTPGDALRETLARHLLAASTPTELECSLAS